MNDNILIRDTLTGQIVSEEQASGLPPERVVREDLTRVRELASEVERLTGALHSLRVAFEGGEARLAEARAAIARVRERHERWPIHGDGDHPEDCDCGDPWVTVCRLCCTDGEDQHETCAVYHDHGPDKPICPTIAAIGGEQS